MKWSQRWTKRSRQKCHDGDDDDALTEVASDRQGTKTKVVVVVTMMMRTTGQS